LVDRLRRLGLQAGLSAVETCAVGSWTSSRSRLEAGRQAGRNADMEFTYRNPARSSEPARILPGARSLVVGAYTYQHDGEPTGQTDRRSVDHVMADVARYARGDSIGALRHRLAPIATELRAIGHRAVVMADDNSMLDREAAWRAGIGSYGKHSNLMLRGGAGSWIVLGAVVTTAALAPSSAPSSDVCGTCTLCMDRCPTGAIVSPGVVDARRCLAWILQAPGSMPQRWRVAVGTRVYGCDTCQEVCPENTRHDDENPTVRPARTGHVAPPSGASVDAVAWLALDDDELLAAAGRWYVADRDPTTLRRNLLIVLGNAGRGDLPGVLTTLESYAAGDDPILAEHARWSLARLETPTAAPTGSQTGPRR